MLKKSLAIMAVAMGVGGAAQAATVTSLLGDKDCFGTNAACVEDGVTWLPGAWASVTQGGGDPAFTDLHIFNGGNTAWTHNFAAGAYTSASLTIRTAGIADIAGPYNVVVDGSVVGAIPFDNASHILVETFTFGVAAALVADGVANVNFVSQRGNSWAIDYSEMTMDMAVIPLPASLPLLAVALGGLGLMRRRKKA